MIDPECFDGLVVIVQSGVLKGISGIARVDHDSHNGKPIKVSFANGKRRNYGISQISVAEKHRKKFLNRIRNSQRV